MCATGGYIVTCHGGNKRRRQLALAGSLSNICLFINLSEWLDANRPVRSFCAARESVCPGVLLNVSRKHLLWRPAFGACLSPVYLFAAQCHCKMSFSQLPPHFCRLCLHYSYKQTCAWNFETKYLSSRFTNIVTFNFFWCFVFSSGCAILATKFCLQNALKWKILKFFLILF